MPDSATLTPQAWRPEDPRSEPPPLPPGVGWLGPATARMLTTSERRRFRFGVLTRAGLASAHVGFLQLVWFPAQFGVLIAWLCVMYEARVPVSIHRFLAGVVQYQTRVFAYAFLLADPFPGFTRRTSYPFDIGFAGPQRHSRRRALFYPVLLLWLLVPSILAIAAMILMAPIAWLYALVIGRVPRWYQRAGTVLFSFLAQSLAFGCLVTDRMPMRSRKLVAEAPWTAGRLPEPRPRQAPLRPLARAGVLLGLLAMAAGVGAAIVLLWDTTVPTNLVTPHLDATRYLDPEVLGNADAAHTADRWFVIAQFASLLALGLFAWRGARWARHSAAGTIGTGVFVGMLGLACAGLAAAPFLALGITAMPDVVETDPAWLIVPIETLAPLSNAAIVLAIAMGVARRLPRAWWLVTAPLLAALLTGAVLISGPIIASDGEKLDDPVLLADARELAAREGIPNADINFIDERDDGTDTPTPTNAFAVGGSGSSEIVLLGSLRTRRELRVMLGHEIAHVARHHTWRTIGWNALFFLIAAALVQFAVRWRGDLYNPAVIPIALVVFAAASLAWSPLDTAASRRYESEADWMALSATRDPQGDIQLMQVLAEENGTAPRDTKLSTTFLADHPDIMSRIEMAVAWRERNRGAKP